MKTSKEQLESFFAELGELESDDWMQKVEKCLDDEAIEAMVSHLEDFYGIDDDEELGMLAQIMVTGFVAGRSLS